MDKTFKEGSEKALKLIVLYGTTLMAYPVAFWSVFMFMSPFILRNLAQIGVCLSLSQLGILFWSLFPQQSTR